MQSEGKSETGEGGGGEHDVGILKGVLGAKISEAWLPVNYFRMPGSWESRNQ